MILVFLLIVAAVLLATCIYLFRQMRKHQKDASLQYENSMFWYGKWEDELAGHLKLQREYDALDQGNTEIEENYQQEILDYHDKYAEQFRMARQYLIDRNRLMEVTEYHETHCLPNLALPDMFYPPPVPSEG